MTLVLCLGMFAFAVRVFGQGTFQNLNFEAAKAVKFGGTTEEEALKFVTINPAKQLHIDKWVGSLEPGKDAGKEDTAAKKKFFKISLEHQYDFQVRHCEEDGN